MKKVAPTTFSFGVIRCSPHGIPDLLAEIRRLLENHTLHPRSILCVNAHIYNCACRNEHLQRCLNEARIVAPDGIVIVWTARLFGMIVPGRCNMTEAYHAFLADPDMPATKAILIGCSETEARNAARKANSSSSHCQVVAAYSGFLQDRDYESILREHRGVDLILLGMGTPRTELLARKACRECPESLVWGIGGGTIRIEAGTMIEAPRFWRRTGLQWLHRLLAEPTVLWRRYLLGNPLFLGRIAVEVVKRKFRHAATPSHEGRYTRDV